MSAYSEETLVQQTIAEYLEQELGLESADAHSNEDFGPDSLLGRKSDREVVLTRTLRDKIEELNPSLLANIHGYIQQFDAGLTNEEFASPHYAYRIFFVLKTANRKGQADRVIEFVNSDSPLAEAVNKEYAVIKETEKEKYLPKQVVDLMQAEGYPGFSIHHHTQLRQSQDAKNPPKGYGTMLAGKVWHWYKRWVDVVRKHCRDSVGEYS